MALKTQPGEVTMGKLVSLAKRRGFVFPSSEIYGGLGSTWDYGPLGVLMKNNIKSAWWRAMVQERDDIVGLDAAILMHPEVWVASGHVGGFVDPLVDCKLCNHRFRADHLWSIEYSFKGIAVRVSIEAGSREEARDAAMVGAVSHGHKAGDLSATRFDEIPDQDRAPCPDCGKVGGLTPPRKFNLMFKTHVGAVEEDASVAYLRPETAQGIFVNFDNVQTTTRKKLPFGIAQIGKAFRNEITTGNFVFRSREFEQMELEYFVKPGTDETWFERWVGERMGWWTRYGVHKENLRLRAHNQAELAFYSKGTSDIEFKFPWGWGEIEGVASRASYDLTQHSQHSGKQLKYFDDEANESFIPYVIEPSSGVDRAFLTFLTDSYEEQLDREEIRTVLHLHPDIAPIKAAILPLSRKEPLGTLAKEVYAKLRKHWFVQYDDAQSIGRRYRRQDEIGTPLCITVDFQTVDDQQVTIRDRDSMQQVRIPISDLVPALRQRLEPE